MHKKLFLTLISLAALHTRIRAMEEGDFVVRGEGGIAQPAVAKAGPKVTVAKKAAKAIPIPAKAPAPAFGTVELSDDESDNGDDASDTSGGTSQSSTPAQDTPPVPAALPKKAAPPKVSAVAAASPKIAPASPAPAIKKAVQKSAPPKPMPAPQHVEEAAAPEETVQVQIAVPKSFFESFASSLGTAITKGHRAVNKRMYPFEYIVDPSNAVRYQYFLQKVDAAQSIEDLKGLSHDPQYEDLLKAIFDRLAYAADQNRTVAADIIGTAQIEDGAKREKYITVLGAIGNALECSTRLNHKLLYFMQAEAQNTVATAQRAAQNLPRSGNLPSVSEDDDNNE